MEAPERYSDKRLADSFTAYVLFSEPLQGSGQEVLEAAREDYPEIGWPGTLLADCHIDTRGVSMVVDFDGGEGTGAIYLLGSPGPLNIDMSTVIERSETTTGKAEAQRIASTHTDHLSVVVHGLKDDPSVPARFAAARKMACLAGVLAKLPTAMGVYFPSADLILTPERWLHGVALAREGQLPLGEWVTTIWSYGGQADGRDLWNASTIGLAAFTGHELNVPRAPVEPRLIGGVVGAVARMLVETDHQCRDSDTVGGEGDALKWRIRHLPEAPDGPQTDTWVLLHPEADVDEEGVFGPRPLPPAPDGIDNQVMGDWGTLRSGLEALTSRRVH